jgi:hypothetical protein
MTRYQCESCGGVYEDPQPGGVTYFHACPPERVDALEGQVDDDGKPVLASVPIEDRRDENIVQDPVVDADGRGRVPAVKMRAEGRGRRAL